MKKEQGKDRLKELEEKNQEYLNDLQRVQAEFENFQKRLEKEKKEFISFANAQLIKDFLPALDSIDAAEKNLEKDEKALEGLRGVKKQLMHALSKHGLKEIEILGKKFDPMLCECISKDCIKEKDDEIVLEEIQKGYLLNEKLLRPSKVKINKLDEKEGDMNE